MTSSEYVNKFFVGLTSATKQEELNDMVKKCFVAFTGELKQTLSTHLVINDSRIDEIKEFQNKWLALAITIYEKPEISDFLDISFIGDLFNEYFARNYPFAYDEIKHVRFDYKTYKTKVVTSLVEKYKIQDSIFDSVTL